ncbi:MAG: hypothetical protein H0Z29_12050 [Candidatus Marinimicrobia bacterium]|nr:hypothetical protein [Candidatus Neomarinimicrobiota bacterium]
MFANFNRILLHCHTTVSKLKPDDYKDRRHYFRSEKDIINLFPNSLEAINNSQYLAERCKTDWSFINTIFHGMNVMILLIMFLKSTV